MSYPQMLTLEEKLADAQARLEIPEIVVLCGSTEFMHEFTETNLRLTVGADGQDPVIVLSVGCNMKTEHPLWADPDDAEALKPRLDALHKAKIRLAARVIVVGTRIGTSTRSEIAYAKSLGKPVTYLHPEVDPAAAPANGPGEKNSGDAVAATVCRALEDAGTFYIAMIGEFPVAVKATLEEAYSYSLDAETRFQAPGTYEHRWDDSQRPGEIWRLMARRTLPGKRSSATGRTVHAVPAAVSPPAREQTGPTA